MEGARNLAISSSRATFSGRNQPCHQILPVSGIRDEIQSCLARASRPSWRSSSAASSVSFERAARTTFVSTLAKLRAVASPMHDEASVTMKPLEFENQELKRQPEVFYGQLPLSSLLDSVSPNNL